MDIRSSFKHNNSTVDYSEDRVSRCMINGSKFLAGSLAISAGTHYALTSSWGRAKYGFHSMDTQLTKEEKWAYRVAEDPIETESIKKFMIDYDEHIEKKKKEGKHIDIK